MRGGRVGALRGRGGGGRGEEEEEGACVRRGEAGSGRGLGFGVWGCLGLFGVGERPLPAGQELGGFWPGVAR